MNSESRFWERPAQWPYDAPGYVFMGRACDQLGQAMLAAEWKGVGNSDQRKKALERIREHCAYSRLSSAIQTGDGSFIEVPPARWNTLNCWQWFESCSISSPEVYGSAHHPLATVTYLPLYVTEESLTRLLKGAGGEEPKREVKQYSEREVRDWSSVLFTESVEANKALITGDKFEKLAEERFPGISSGVMRRVWATRPSPPFLKQAPRTKPTQ